MTNERENLHQEWKSLLPLFQKRLRGKMLIALDFDGTLSPANNPQFDEAIQTALAVRGSEFLREQGEIVEVEGLKREIRETYLRGESVTIFFQEKLRIPRSFIEGAYNSVEKWRFLKRDSELMPILAELVERGYQLALASNSPEEENLLALGQLGVNPEIFSFKVNMKDVKRSKPYPDMFEKILELSGLPVEECVFVGDSLTKDIQGAKGIGMDGVLVGEVSDEAVAWVPQIYDLPQLFVQKRFQVVFVEGESGVSYPHVKDTQAREIIGLGNGNELFLDLREAEKVATLLNSGVFPNGISLE